MSNIRANPLESENVQVIVRAFGDEPVLLSARGGESGRVKVVGDDENWSLNYPGTLVYEYDKRCFAKIRSAYEQGDLEAMNDLWDKLSRYSLR